MASADPLRVTYSGAQFAVDIKVLKENTRAGHGLPDAWLERFDIMLEWAEGMETERSYLSAALPIYAHIAWTTGRG